jgi:hypothetical protein
MAMHVECLSNMDLGLARSSGVWECWASVILFEALMRLAFVAIYTFIYPRQFFCLNSRRNTAGAGGHHSQPLLLNFTS